MLKLRDTMLILIALLTLAQWHRNEVSSANILALMTTPSPSHHIWNRSLMLALAARGHHVTVVSPNAEKQPVPNHRDILLKGVYDYADENYVYEDFTKLSTYQMALLVFEWGSGTCKTNLASQGAKQLMELSANETFDLIIVESAMQECFLGFIPMFNSPPVIAITAFSIPPWANSLVGNPANPAYISGYLLPYTDHMTFFQRTINFMLLSFVHVYRRWYHLPEQEKTARQHFGNSLPPLIDIERNISLVMVNGHYSFDFPRPMVPSMIPVAGMHIKPAKALPKDLQQFLDEAKDGAIYFSLGSNIRSDRMTADKIQMFLDVFSQLPQKVLWKWESDSLPGQPKNVKLGKWLPQNDILAHPNIRLFITHSGLLSTQESFYHGVPVVGMPFMVDQFMNIKKVIDHGLGKGIDYNTLTKESVLEAVQTVINNPSYHEKAKVFSSLFRDQPETPIERAVYWTEYVIRHKGAPHLRSAALDLHWFQYLLLDVIAFLVFVMVMVSLLIYFVITRVYRTIIVSKRNIKEKVN